MSYFVSVDLKPFTGKEVRDFADLLIQVNNHLQENNRVITRIIYNGEDVDEVRERELLNQPLKEEDYIEFYSNTPISIAVDSFTCYVEILPAMVEDLKIAIGKLRVGELKMGFDYIADSFDVFQLFNATATQVDSLFIANPECHIDRTQFQCFDVLAQLPNKLQDLTDALKTEDSSTTADLIEDDLLPVIELCANEAPRVLQELTKLTNSD
jgi:hypothetical protein